MEWVRLILALIVGIATAIPLIAKLIDMVEQYVRERNWSKLLKLVMDLMGTAEGMFDNGIIKKNWVLESVAALSDTVDYDIDMEEVSALIDSLCAMSKQVNYSAKAV